MRVITCSVADSQMLATQFQLWVLDSNCKLSSGTCCEVSCEQVASSRPLAWITPERIVLWQQPCSVLGTCCEVSCEHITTSCVNYSGTHCALTTTLFGVKKLALFCGLFCSFVLSFRDICPFRLLLDDSICFIQCESVTVAWKWPKWALVGVGLMCWGVHQTHLRSD